MARSFALAGTTASRALIVALGLAIVGGTAAVAAEPDITGLWDYQGRGRGAARPEGPPVTPALAAQIKMQTAARDKNDGVRGVGNMLCIPTGFPQMMMWKSPIEILQTRGRITVISEHDPGPDEPRTIYMNKPQATDYDLTWNGHSVGHWEGETLVIDTVGLNDRVMVTGRGLGVPRTPTTHVVEHMHLEDAGKTLIDEITVTDPATLTKPWIMTAHYNRMPEGTERFEAVCETDFEALNETDLEKAKVYDSAAARLADPKYKYNPGGR